MGKLIRKIAPEDLGKSGEHHFAKICSSVGLTCNRAIDLDRTGWDFIVEFPFSYSPSTESLDKRPAPISFYAQVKTVWDPNDRIRVRLSAANWLAQEKKPSFFYVLTSDANVNFVSAYLIHIDGPVMDKILMELRKVQARNKGGANRKFIEFNVMENGIKLAPDGESLKHAILKICGNNLGKYMEEKEKNRKSRGFSGKAVRGKMFLSTTDISETQDWLLGRKELFVDRIEVYETRFGVELPLDRELLRGANVKITPTPVAQCVISLNSKSGALSDLKAEIIAPPPISFIAPEDRKYLIQTKFFEVEIFASRLGIDSSRVNQTPPKYNIDEWIEFFSFMRCLADGANTLKVRPFLGVEFNIEFSNLDHGLDRRVFERDLRKFRSKKALLTFAGRGDLEISYFDAIEEGPDIAAASQIALGGKQKHKLEFKLEPIGGIIVPDATEFLLIRRFCYGGIWFAYYFLYLIKRSDRLGAMTWESTSIRKREMITYSGIQSEYESFSDSTRLKYESAVFWDDFDRRLNVETS